MTVALLVLGFGPAGGQELEPAQPPCAADEYRQFEFWIGEWRVETAQGHSGRNRIEKVLGGCALHESWEGVRGLRGHSYNYYDPLAGTWHQTWIDSHGTFLHLQGTLSDGRMVLEGERRTAEGGILDRIIWTPLEGGDVRQEWLVSADGGDTWRTIFDGRYRRVSDGAGPE